MVLVLSSKQVNILKFIKIWCVVKYILIFKQSKIKKDAPFFLKRTLALSLDIIKAHYKVFKYLSNLSFLLILNVKRMIKKI